MVGFLKWVGISCVALVVLGVAALFFLVLLSAPRKDSE